MGCTYHCIKINNSAQRQDTGILSSLTTLPDVAHNGGKFIPVVGEWLIHHFFKKMRSSVGLGCLNEMSITWGSPLQMLSSKI